MGIYLLSGIREKSGPRQTLISDIESNMRNGILLLTLFLLTGVQACYLSAGAKSSDNTEIADKSTQYGHVNFTESQSGQEQSNIPNTVNAPVTPQENFVEGVTLYSDKIGADQGNRLAQAGVKIGSESADGYICLEEGNVLLTPDKNITVGTSEGKILLGKGASVFVMVSGDDLVLYDLLQTEPQQVVVTVVINKQKIVMQPQRMLVLTRKAMPNFENLAVNCHQVACRNPQQLNLRSNEVKAYIADFSLTSALMTIEPLKRLTISNY